MNLNPFAALRARRQVAEPAGDVRAQAVTLDEVSELFRAFAGSYATSTGVSVTSDSAVASVAVLACLIVRAESLMLCPVDVYKRDGRNRSVADEDPRRLLLADEWNPLLGAEEGWRWKQNTEDLKGNAYVRVVWDRGYPAELWPLHGLKPQLITAKVNGKPFLVYRYSGDEFTPADDYPAADIMHFKGPVLSRTPYEARSLIDVTAENIGLGIATEQFFARFLGNGNHFPMYLQTDEKLQKDDVDALLDQMNDGAGLLPAGTTRVFDRGLKVMSRDMSLRDADLSAHQRWILEQVCRTFRVPLPMVQDLTHGTYTNSEQADLWLSKYTATPIVKNTEGVLRRKLFLPSERGTMYAKFNVNAMMRGDFTARTAGYSILIACGVLNPNEARAFEDWNPYEGGDEYRAQVNTAPVGGGSVDGTTNALATLLGDAKDRIAARHRQNAERGRDTSDSMEFGSKVLAPIVSAAAAMGVELDGDQIARLVIEEAAQNG